MDGLVRAASVTWAELGKTFNFPKKLKIAWLQANSYTLMAVFLRPLLFLPLLCTLVLIYAYHEKNITEEYPIFY